MYVPQVFLAAVELEISEIIILRTVGLLNQGGHVYWRGAECLWILYIFKIVIYHLSFFSNEWL